MERRTFSTTALTRPDATSLRDLENGGERYARRNDEQNTHISASSDRRSTPSTRPSTVSSRRSSFSSGDESGYSSTHTSMTSYSSDSAAENVGFLFTSEARERREHAIRELQTDCDVRDLRYHTRTSIRPKLRPQRHWPENTRAEASQKHAPLQDVSGTRESRPPRPNSVEKHRLVAMAALEGRDVNEYFLTLDMPEIEQAEGHLDDAARAKSVVKEGLFGKDEEGEVSASAQRSSRLRRRSKFSTTRAEGPTMNALPTISEPLTPKPEHFPTCRSTEDSKVPQSSLPARGLAIQMARNNDGMHSERSPKSFVKDHQIDVLERDSVTSRSSDNALTNMQTWRTSLSPVDQSPSHQDAYGRTHQSERVSSAGKRSRESPHSFADRFVCQSLANSTSRAGKPLARPETQNALGVSVAQTSVPSNDMANHLKGNGAEDGLGSVQNMDESQLALSRTDDEQSPRVQGRQHWREGKIFPRDEIERLLGIPAPTPHSTRLAQDYMHIWNLTPERPLLATAILRFTAILTLSYATSVAWHVLNTKGSREDSKRDGISPDSFREVVFTVAAICTLLALFHPATSLLRDVALKSFSGAVRRFVNRRLAACPEPKEALNTILGYPMALTRLFSRVKILSVYAILYTLAMTLSFLYALFDVAKYRFEYDLGGEDVNWLLLGAYCAVSSNHDDVSIWPSDGKPLHAPADRTSFPNEGISATPVWIPTPVWILRMRLARLFSCSIHLCAISMAVWLSRLFNTHLSKTSSEHASFLHSPRAWPLQSTVQWKNSLCRIWCSPSQGPDSLRTLQWDCSCGRVVQGRYALRVTHEQSRLVQSLPNCQVVSGMRGWTVALSNVSRRLQGFAVRASIGKLAARRLGGPNGSTPSNSIDPKDSHAISANSTAPDERSECPNASSASNASRSSSSASSQSLFSSSSTPASSVSGASSTSLPSTADPKPAHFELCVNRGNLQITLDEIHLVDGRGQRIIESDIALINAIRERYHQHCRKGLYSYLYQPADIHWVRFGVQQRGVDTGIYQSPRAIPPAVEVKEGRYHYHECPLEDMPPIAKETFFHYFRSRHDPNAATIARSVFYERMPKKLGSSVFEQCEPGKLHFGWGLHIIEGPNKPLLAWLVSLIMVSSLLVAVVYDLCLKNTDSGFAIGQWMVGVLATWLAALYFHLADAV